MLEYSFFKKKIIFLPVLGLCCCAGFSLVTGSGGYSVLQCAGFSLWRLLLRQSVGSRARAQLLCDMWDFPGPGIKPVTPALAGGLPEPLGTTQYSFL